ncbi:universal stress protein [Rhodovulum sulfidophilum]|uniref:universal stress protein n=1 Tax=Rhodovulum sulfidophilum TaxID=35806 RepID=UPI001921CFD3|nr:universal stress protein [Rhodovulum sulfidophilum]MBL3595526.1 universal stress protein [Rhodovulum sulfidophilum]
MTATFLVATDLSPRADRAVNRAFRLASWTGADILLAAVIDSDLPEDVARPLAEAAETRLARFAASIPHSAEVRHDTRILTGDPSAAIPLLAEEIDAALIVLGLHRDRPFLDLIRETTMERIVRHAARPVLLVRDPVDHDYAALLAALDFAPASTAAVKIAADLAPEATIHGVHALHIPYRGFVAPHGSSITIAPFRRSAEMRLAEWRSDPDLPERLAEIDIVEGAAHVVLNREIEDHAPDLLVLGAHGRAGDAPSILGSLANDLMRHPPCDLLIAR